MLVYVHLVGGGRIRVRVAQRETVESLTCKLVKRGSVGRFKLLLDAGTVTLRPGAPLKDQGVVDGSILHQIPWAWGR